MIAIGPNRSVGGSIPPLVPFSIRRSVYQPCRIAVTVLDCTPGMRHDNCSDSAVAMMRYRALFCANAVSNSSGDWYPSAECSRSLL